MLKENFTPGQPLAALSAKWLNDVAAILNHIQIVQTDDAIPTIEKPTVTNQSRPWRIKIPRTSGGSSGGALQPFTMPYTLRYDTAKNAIVEDQLEFDGANFKKTGKSQTVLTFTEAGFNFKLVTDVVNTGSAIVKHQRTVRVFAPQGAIPQEESGDATQSTVISLTPRDANESTPYNEDGSMS